jgi:hypothetical protein
MGRQVFKDEIEYYCGNCGLQVAHKTGKCPHCGAPLSITLLPIPKKEREWTNPDKWQIGRKGWIQAKFDKRWYPTYEEWLYTTKHKSKGELSLDEIRQTVEEYRRFIEERKKHRNSWKLT